MSLNDFLDATNFTRFMLNAGFSFYNEFLIKDYRLSNFFDFIYTDLEVILLESYLWLFFLVLKVYLLRSSMIFLAKSILNYADFYFFSVNDSEIIFFWTLDQLLTLLLKISPTDLSYTDLYIDWPLLVYFLCRLNPDFT